MKRAVLALLCMSLVPAYAQQVKDAAVAVEETEAMVTVTKVDKEKRTELEAAKQTLETTQ